MSIPLYSVSIYEYERAKSRNAAYNRKTISRHMLVAFPGVSISSAAMRDYRGNDAQE